MKLSTSLLATLLLSGSALGVGCENTATPAEGAAPARVEAPALVAPEPIAPQITPAAEQAKLDLIAEQERRLQAELKRHAELAARPALQLQTKPPSSTKPKVAHKPKHPAASAPMQIRQPRDPKWCPGCGMG